MIFRSSLLLFLLCLFTSTTTLLAQSIVPIESYSVEARGNVRIEVNSTTDRYYALQARQNETSSIDKLPKSITKGQEGTTILTESLKALPESHYQVVEYSLVQPADQDRDGLDDISELEDRPTNSPLNAASQVKIIDGAVSVDSKETYETLSVVNSFIPWATFLNDQEYVKFAVADIFTDNPQIYFINSNTHYIHQDFYSEVGWSEMDFSGEIIFNPNIRSDNGSFGVYSFVYSFGYPEEFEVVQKTHELIARNMPYIENNLAYYITTFAEDDYFDEQDLYDDSRVSVVFENEIFEDVTYLPLNVAEGFGLLRALEPEETPGSKDIVLYESVPNFLPRVGGIITSFIQTPLSHVNLRAIQDGVPNAFIRDPLSDPVIAGLIDKFIYYRVALDRYEIREATQAEVDAWFEDLRPTEEQVPIRNLDYKDILPLDDINFSMSDGFGAKCTNVATMRSFGFPEGVIPDGYGVPFHFYNEFMLHNNFYEQIQQLIEGSDFKNDREFREEALSDLRKEIRAAEMPQWMLDELESMHRAFPEGTAVRCRSSTNNEDLPGFSGAGLYTSKTQHLDEGHISKSIKQVYASMWNLRAFEERDFYRIDHLIAAMGVLCHPNYEEEIANGVGVTLDPIYGTVFTHYINTQVGENLVTNPEANSIPEEIILERLAFLGDRIVRFSNLVGENELIMTEEYRDELRGYMGTIHDEFGILYEAQGEEDFGMDIEYKITSEDRLIIKQARPWVSFWTALSSTVSTLDQTIDVSIYPNPFADQFIIQLGEIYERLVITDLKGQTMESIEVVQEESITIEASTWSNGPYFIIGLQEDGSPQVLGKVVKN